jgi:hypothetical protein
MAHSNGLAPVLDAPSEDASESTKYLRRSARLAVMAASGEAGLRSMESQSLASVRRIESATKRLEDGTQTAVGRLDAAAEAGSQKFQEMSKRIENGITSHLNKVHSDVDTYKQSTQYWLQSASGGLRDLSEGWKEVRKSTDVIQESVAKAAKGLADAQSLLAMAFWMMAVSGLLLLAGAWAETESSPPGLKPWAPRLVIAGLVGSAFTVGLLAGARRVSAHIKL